jgi:hypothetical protein
MIIEGDFRVGSVHDTACANLISPSGHEKHHFQIISKMKPWLWPAGVDSQM